MDVNGTGEEAEFTFKGVPKPGEMPDAPPAGIGSKAASGGTGGRLTNGVHGYVQVGMPDGLGRGRRTGGHRPRTPTRSHHQALRWFEPTPAATCINSP